jgi:CubicO group peptidase (beta-lactamase class C family)
MTRQSKLRPWRAPRGARLLRLGLAASFVLLFSVLPFSGSRPAPAAEWSRDKASRADALVANFLAHIDRDTLLIPKAALVYGVAARQGLVASKGYREAAPGVPATEHTVYHIGSLAKQFTAAGILDLIGHHATLRDGTPISLDLALSRIFSGVAHWPSIGTDLDKQPVTLRTLLTMTSNLPNFTRLPPTSTDPWGRIAASELLSEIKKLRPSGWPNTFEYSNTSYFLLAEAIEEAVLPGDAVPRAHRAYLRKAIFPRANLVETGFVDDPAPGSVEAVAIHRRRPVFDQPDWLKGSADITSSIADLASWNAALMDGRMLSPDLRAWMFSDGARVTPDVYYGMGWFIEHGDKVDLYSHSGLVPGFTSYNIIAADPATRDWVSVSVLINTDVAEGIDVLARDLLWLARE